MEEGMRRVTKLRLRQLAGHVCPSAQQRPAADGLSIDLEGRRCLITGAGGGIGRDIVVTLLRCNARVLAVDSDADALRDLQEHAGDAAGLEVRSLDITDVQATDALVEEAAGSEAGPVSLLVNCAGVAVFEPYLETTEAEFDREYSVNVKPAVFITQAVAAKLIERGLPGSVVHISSQSSTFPVRCPTLFDSWHAPNTDQLARVCARRLRTTWSTRRPRRASTTSCASRRWSWASTRSASTQCGPLSC